jgi:hypothetical protein
MTLAREDGGRSPSSFLNRYVSQGVIVGTVRKNNGTRAVFHAKAHSTLSALSALSLSWHCR